MTRDESLVIVDMVVSGWPDARPLDRDEIDLYARSIQDLDAELATHAVLKAVKETGYRLKASELRERVRIARRQLASELPPLEPQKGEPVPLWVKRWICARMLHGKFGKQRDNRRFTEQHEYGDPTQPTMPEGAWEKEAETLSEQESWSVFSTILKKEQT